MRRRSRAVTRTPTSAHVAAWIASYSGLADTTQIFQYSSDLSHWTDVSVTGIAGSEGTADGAGVQSVTVTIPRGTSPTMFGRLKVLQP